MCEFEPKWVDTEVLEVGQAVERAGSIIVVLMSNPGDPVSFVHRLHSRESVEKVARALGEAADILWPKGA